MSPFNQPKGMVAYGDIGVMLSDRISNAAGQHWQRLFINI